VLARKQEAASPLVDCHRDLGRLLGSVNRHREHGSDEGIVVCVTYQPIHRGAKRAEREGVAFVDKSAATYEGNRLEVPRAVTSPEGHRLLAQLADHLCAVIRVLTREIGPRGPRRFVDTPHHASQPALGPSRHLQRRRWPFDPGQ